MTKSFDDSVNDWDDLVGRKEALSAKMKKATAKMAVEMTLLNSQEMEARKALAGVLKAFFEEKGELKEGVNNYTIKSTGRKLKLTLKKTRTIDDTQIALSRQEFEKLNDLPDGFAFDDLLRVKYELNVKDFRKLNSEAQNLAVSRMLITKDAAPVLVLD